MRRPVGPAAAFVHDLLRQLEEAGFEGAPRFLGVDDEGREILSFVEGEVPTDCRAIVRDDRQLAAAADLLRRLHDATAGTDLAAESEVVCHNDFGPWNLVWREGLPVAIIDFDQAGPGERLDDLGYSVWKHLNLGLLDLPVEEQARRIRVMTSAYGVAVGSDVLAAVERAQERMQRKLEAGPGADPAAEPLSILRREREWLAANIEGLREASLSRGRS